MEKFYKWIDKDRVGVLVLVWLQYVLFCLPSPLDDFLQRTFRVVSLELLED